MACGKELGNEVDGVNWGFHLSQCLEAQPCSCPLLCPMSLGVCSKDSSAGATRAHGSPVSRAHTVP